MCIEEGCMRFLQKTSWLVLASTTVGLLACGGGGGGGAAVDEFPEPLASSIELPASVQGFYDTDRQGNERVVRNDLQGNFAAMVQFAQNRTVDPAGNEAKRMSRLVSEREALLLVTPDASMGQLNSLSVNVWVSGEQKLTLKLSPPNEIFRADRYSSDERPDVVYSRRAWSAVLPWHLVVPGMELRFTDHQGRKGTLASSNIDFGLPANLIINQIQLGLLTEPPTKTKYWEVDTYMLDKPAEAGSDFFQTIPAASLLVASYEPLQLDKVIVANGNIYTSSALSQTPADVHSGDMRENVAKSTFSVGINLANWGITSASMSSQEQPQLTQQVVAHHAVGRYQYRAGNTTPDQLVLHGLSGGNSILTLLKTVGNEFSHEIGHHFGLSHYPGQSETDPATDFWNRQHADSGWGYIAYRHRMRSNLDWGSRLAADATALSGFKGLYPYAFSPMSGGSPTSSLSSYTAYTGFDTQDKVQPAFDRWQYSKDSPSGYMKWDAAQRKMVSATPRVPSSSAVWYNSVDGNYRKPRLFGVPVFTILGGYDPEDGTAVVYPAARSNWGNVFDLPAPVENATTRQCWLAVDYVSKPLQRIALAPTRLGGNSNRVNKFAVNLAQEDQPTAARLYCQAPNAVEQLLGDITIPQGLPPMKAAVVIGKEKGYSALFAVEKSEFESALNTLADMEVPLLDDRGRLLYESWAAKAGELDSTAKAQLLRYERLQDSVTRLNRWMTTYRTSLQDGDDKAKNAMMAFIKKLELGNEGSLLPTPSTLYIAQNNCLKTEVVDGKVGVYISGAAGCTGEANERWIVDSTHRIRNGANLNQCLSFGSDVAVSSCDLNVASQQWEIEENGNNFFIKRGNKCMDLANGYLTNGRGKLITWTCSGGRNQIFTGVSVDRDHALLPLLWPDNLALLVQLSSVE